MNGLKGLKILYIDDEELIRMNAVEYLSFYCDNVYEAKDGIEGFQVYEKVRPDIIITDIQMPRCNGLEMVKKIRKDDKDTKIIIATAFVETSYLLMAVELGLIKYLIKPMTESKLLPVLNDCLIIEKEKNSILHIDKHFTFDSLNKTLFCNREQIALTKKELMFLDMLVLNLNRTVKYEEFDQQIWQGEMSADAMRAVVKELRAKISKKSIKNISGIGYRLVPKVLEELS